MKSSHILDATESACIISAIWALPACQKPIGDRDLTDADAWMRLENA